MTRFLIIGTMSVALLLGASPALALSERAPASSIAMDWLGQVLDQVERWFGWDAVQTKVDPEAGEDMPPRDSDGTLGDQVIPRK